MELFAKQERMKENLATKTKQKDFKTLFDRFDVFSRVETVQHMDKELLPKLEEFMRQLDSYKASHQTMREVI